MTLDQTWLVGTAQAERGALGRTIQYTPPDRWDAESANPGWLNRDVVAHLAATEVAAASVMAGEEATEVEEFRKTLNGAPFTVAAFNDFTVRRRLDEPLRSVIKEWGQAADLLLQRAAQIPPDEWRSRKVRWLVDEIGASYLVQSRVAEWWLHGDDIRDGAGLQPRVEHPPIYCMNDLAVRMIPYSLGVAGLSFPGRSVQVDLDAAGGGSWHWGLARGDMPAARKSADAYIEGRAYAFAMVAGGRVPADYYLGEGILTTGGDVDLADTILQHLRAFPA